ncbi:LamG-like jellyroll fold domain-containing protein [Pyxidicoccus sp. 3LFB2]
MYQYGAADLRYGQSIQFGGTSPIDTSGSASYSIGFWVRPRAPAYDGRLLKSGSSFYIGQHGLQLTLSLPGMSAPQRSELELLPGHWQYVLLVFETQGPQMGAYTLYANGAPLIEGALSHVTASSGPFVLGANTDAQFFNVSFWSAAIPEGERQPLWDAPPPGPTLAACYSFADGSASDVSGNNLGAASLLGGAQVVMVAPALRVVNAAVQPSPRDALTVAADGAPFSVQAWINADAPSEYQAPFRTVFSCKDRNTGYGCAMGLEWNSDGTGFSLSFKQSLETGQSGWGHTLQLAPGGWHHLAVTYDGTRAQMYLDGVLTVQSSVVLPVLSAPVTMFGATYDADVPGEAAMEFQGYFQAAALWSRALSASEVQQYMAQSPADAEEGCVAFYGWDGLSIANQVTGNPPLLLNMATPALVVTPPSESTPPPGVSDEAQLAKVEPAARTRNAVRWSTEAVPYPENSPIPREQIEAIIAAFEPVLAAVPGAMKDRLRSQFRNNLYLGLSRGNGPSGMPVGAITRKRVGNECVFYHHTAMGAEECGRMELTVNWECVSWVISVAATSLCLLMSVLGLGYSAVKTVSALKPLIQDGTPLLRAIVRAASGATSGNTVIQVIKCLYASGSFGRAVSAAMTGHWWNIAINTAVFVASVASLLLSGGAYLAVVLVQLALGIVALVMVISQKPANCC